MSQFESLNRAIQRLRQGDTEVRGELLNLTRERMRDVLSRLAQQLGGRAAARLITDAAEQVLDRVSASLFQRLHDCPVQDRRHFYQLASLEMRKELLQWFEQSRHQPADSNLTHDLSEMVELHRCIDQLPKDQREVFELIWYHGLTRDQAGELLQRSEREVLRCWRAARLELHKRLPVKVDSA